MSSIYNQTVALNCLYAIEVGIYAHRTVKTLSNSSEDLLHIYHFARDTLTEAGSRFWESRFRRHCKIIIADNLPLASAALTFAILQKNKPLNLFFLIDLFQFCIALHITRLMSVALLTHLSRQPSFEPGRAFFEKSIELIITSDLRSRN